MARLVIDLKKEANAELVLNYLLKNTDLQINYNFNMVAIVNRRPKLVGVLDILDAFIAHQKEVVTRRTKFDLEAAKVRFHILEGLMKAISILDKVIATIRASKNKSNAIENLCKEYDFTYEQAKAIVELQLYRLTNTDIVDLQNEMAKLQKDMYIWEQILNNEEALKHVMKQELKLIKKEYADARRTEIKDEVTEIKIDLKSMIPKENVVVVVTKEGYIKRVSSKSYAARTEAPTMKPGDYLTNIFDVTTLDHIVFFTNMGNYIFLPVHKIPEAKWKDLGKHINNIVTLNPEEKLVASFIYEPDKDIISVSKLGMIKRTKMKDYEVTRTSKAMASMKLKDNDEVVSVIESNEKVMIISDSGYACIFNKLEVPLVGTRGSGVKGIALKDDEVSLAIALDNAEYVTLLTNQNTMKRIKALDLEETGRAKRGLSILKKVKSTNYKITSAVSTTSRSELTIIAEDKIANVKNSDIPIMDLASTGSMVSKHKIVEVLLKVDLEAKQEEINKPTEQEPTQVSFDLNEFKL